MDYVRELSFTNDLSELARLAEAIEAFGEECGLSVAEIYKVNLVLDELLTNVISYAYPDQAQHLIGLHLSLAEGRLVCVLTDDASPFNPLDDAKPAVLEGSIEDRPIGGLGVHFICTIMDEVSYQRLDRCNQLTLIKRVGPQSVDKH